VLAELLADAAAAAPPPCLDLLVVDVKAIAPSVEARARMLALVGSDDSVREAAGIFAQALRDWAALQPRAARVLFLATIDPANKKSGQLVCGVLRKLFVQARRAGAVLPSPSSQIGWLCTSVEFNAAIDSALTGTGAEVDDDDDDATPAQSRPSVNACECIIRDILDAAQALAAPPPSNESESVDSVGDDAGATAVSDVIRARAVAELMPMPNRVGRPITPSQRALISGSASTMRRAVAQASRAWSACGDGAPHMAKSSSPT
jgi:hypothetical protein